MDKSCPDFTKSDGEFEDNRPLVCGENPYGDDDEDLVDQTNEERKTICANEFIANKREETKKCL